MESNKPEAKMKIGAINASIWKREHKTKDGRTFEGRQVSIDRTYKDKNDQWQSANNFDANDVPKAILALQEAYAYMVKRPDAAFSEVVVEDVK